MTALISSGVFSSLTVPPSGKLIWAFATFTYSCRQLFSCAREYLNTTAACKGRGSICTGPATGRSDWKARSWPSSARR